MDFKPEDVIGKRFTVRQLLGRGGVGVVYRVFDAARDEEVALKVLHPELASNKPALERFMREVKTIRRIDHPGIVPVYGTGRIGESLFYTMEYVRGRSAKGIIEAEGPLSLQRAAALMRDVCAIVEKVHEVAIHRDISSDNVMIQKDGAVRMLDFGTARLSDEQSELTRPGMHLGKVYYSAPEQAKSARHVDHRADLYSLGVLFFELLTAKLVMRCQSVQDFRADLPRELDGFFEKALAPGPEDRFASAAAMARALKAFR